MEAIIMSYSLLAHLFPRIKGSQEDIATYSLSYILEQSPIMNETFTRLISKKACLTSMKALSYKCQDADSEFGRPDIAGYDSGTLKILCEAKFYAGLTINQPTSYLRRLKNTENSCLIFICPRERVTSLWSKLIHLLNDDKYIFSPVTDQCISYYETRMTIISWGEILSELLLVAEQNNPEMIGDIRQLDGFCKKIENDAFIPFDENDFSVQTARNIDRYYEVVDEVHSLLKSHNELSPNTKGLRNSPRWQGYSTYIVLNGKGVSVDFIRKLWKKPTSIITPFWCSIRDIENGKWVVSEKLNRYYSSIDSKYTESFFNEIYFPLIPKPYQSLEELSETLAGQIIDYLLKYEEFI